MATRQSDSLKLVNRAQAVADAGLGGWRVEQSPDGYKIFDATGGMHTIHLTYSDLRSLTNARVRLENAGGLKAAEALLKKTRAVAKNQKLTTERQAAEKKAENMASNNTAMLAKAAGPYMTGAEEPDLAWLTSAHPAPWMRWMYITPEVAEKLLADYNDDNRPMADDTARHYAALILSGQWHLTHQGMAMDVRPKVQDAQHRLRGVVLAGNVDPDVKVPFAVFVGMPVENFKAVDAGRLRNAAQMLKKGGVPGGTHVVTILRTIKAWDSDNPRGYHRGRKYSTVEAFADYEKDPENFTKAYTLGSQGYKRTRISPGIYGAAWYLISRVNGFDNEYVEAFFTGITRNRKHNTQLVLPDDDPRAVLLSKYSNARPPSPVEGVLWIVTAWNNLVKNHHPSYMRVSTESAIPEILRCLPGAGRSPRALAGELRSDLLENA